MTKGHDGGRVVSLTHPTPLPPGNILVLISVRGWVDPRAIVRSEGFYVHEKIPIPAGIEPATFRFVAPHLNHCAAAVSCTLWALIYIYIYIFFASLYVWASSIVNGSEYLGYETVRTPWLNHLHTHADAIWQYFAPTDANDRHLNSTSDYVNIELFGMFSRARFQDSNVEQLRPSLRHGCYEAWTSVTQWRPRVLRVSPEYGLARTSGFLPQRLLEWNVLF